MSHTSLDAYTSLKSNGYLTGLQLKAYEILFEHGPLTQGEAWSEFLPDYQRHSVAPRFAELEKMGLIQTVGERECRYSHVKGLEWDVTDQALLEKPVKEVSRNKKLQEEVPHIKELLNKLNIYFSALPEGTKQENLHYDVNQLLEKLQ